MAAGRAAFRSRALCESQGARRSCSPAEGDGGVAGQRIPIRNGRRIGNLGLRRFAADHFSRSRRHHHGPDGSLRAQGDRAGPARERATGAQRARGLPRGPDHEPGRRRRDHLRKPGGAGALAVRQTPGGRVRHPALGQSRGPPSLCEAAAARRRVRSLNHKAIVLCPARISGRCLDPAFFVSNVSERPDAAAAIRAAAHPTT